MGRRSDLALYLQHECLSSALLCSDHEHVGTVGREGGREGGSDLALLRTSLCLAEAVQSENGEDPLAKSLLGLNLEVFGSANETDYCSYLRQLHWERSRHRKLT